MAEAPKKSPEGEGKQEGEAKEEKPLTELFSEDVDNRDKFEKLSDKTKDFAAGLFERAKMDVVDRAKVMFNDKLFGWHHLKAVSLKFKLEDKKTEIERLEKLRAEHDSRLGLFQRSRERPLDPKIMQKAALEKEEMSRMIEKGKNRADKLQSKLEHRNQKKNIYENQRNRICQNVIEKVDSRLEPYEKKLEKFKGQKEQLDLEVKKFQERQKENSAQLKELEDKIKKSPYKTERKVYRIYVKEAKNAVKENEKLIKEKNKASAKKSREIAKFDGKANPWRDKREKFIRVIKRETAETGVPKRKKGKVEWREKEIEATTRIEEEKEEEIKEKSEKTAGEAEAEEAKKEPKFTVKEFMDTWNSYFGSNLPLAEKQFSEVLGPGYDFNEEIGLGQFLKKLKDYYILAKAQGLVAKKGIKDKEFQKYIGMFVDLAIEEVKRKKEKGKKEAAKKEPEEFETKKVEPETGEAKEEEKIKEAEEAKTEEAKKEIKEAGVEKEEAEELEEVEKPTWGSISKKERKFWVDRFGKGGARSLFRQYRGDFEDLAKLRANQKKYVAEWKKLREEEAAE